MRGLTKIAAVLLIAAIAAGCMPRGASRPATSPAQTDKGIQPVIVGVVLREFEFEPRPLRTKAGRVRFLLINRGRGEHDFAIPSVEGTALDAKRILRPGETKTIEIELTPGTYQAICRLPGHQEAGMVVTVEVRS